MSTRDELQSRRQGVKNITLSRTLQHCPEIHREEDDYHGDLSHAWRDYIGELLAEVVADFNETTNAGEEKRAFQQTALPGRNKGKRLQAELDKCKDHGREPLPLYTPHPNPTPEPGPSRSVNV